MNNLNFLLPITLDDYGGLSNFLLYLSMDLADTDSM